MKQKPIATYLIDSPLSLSRLFNASAISGRAASMEFHPKPLEAEVETVLVSIPVYIITLINPAEYRNGSA